MKRTFSLASVSSGHGRGARRCAAHPSRGRIRTTPPSQRRCSAAARNARAFMHMRIAYTCTHMCL
eukprot:3399020-Pyramimonas_sp.AAC.1